VDPYTDVSIIYMHNINHGAFSLWLLFGSLAFRGERNSREEEQEIDREAHTPVASVCFLEALFLCTWPLDFVSLRLGPEEKIGRSSPAGLAVRSLSLSRMSMQCGHKRDIFKTEMRH
jgi:hypothetical protein